jgi:hypothetical protein
MFAATANVGEVREKWAAQLTDAALELAARHGVAGASVDQELDFWKAVRHVQGSQSEVPCNSPACRDHLAAKLTDALYGVILTRGFSGSFLDVRLDLWNTLRAKVAHTPVLA